MIVEFAEAAVMTGEEIPACEPLPESRDRSKVVDLAGRIGPVGEPLGGAMRSVV